MKPIGSQQSVSSYSTLAAARQQLMMNYAPFLPVYHLNSQNIVAIIYLRDLLNADLKKKVLDISRPPWFVTQDASILQILEQFRRNNQTVAVILDAGGQASGMLSLDYIIDSLFGPEQYSAPESEKGGLYVERTVSGSLTVEQFNHDFQSNLSFEQDGTMSELIVSKLGHPPAKGESVEIGSYELVVLEPSLRGAKTISVKTIE
jgi:CBS domain containing-hemolysin-like protein